MMANLKLMLDVEVQAGNEGSSRYSLPGLLALLERLPRTCWPEFIRGDCDFGNNTIMSDLETVGCHYLFKVKKTRKVIEPIHRLHSQGERVRYDRQWEGKVSTLQLTGWENERRVVIVRRKLPDDQIILLEQAKKKGQLTLELLEGPEDMKAYEYSVLVTSMPSGIVTLIAHYRQRATCENNFDEIKNQWGWCGFTTKDIKRCRLTARMIALVYNWWSLFVRMSTPDSHKEAITSRPMLMSSVGRLTVSGRKKMSLTSMHGLMEKVKRLQTDVSEFLNSIASIAPQLSPINAWCRILTRAVRYLQNGMVITPIPLLNPG